MNFRFFVNFSIKFSYFYPIFIIQFLSSNTVQFSGFSIECNRSFVVVPRCLKDNLLKTVSHGLLLAGMSLA